MSWRWIDRRLLVILHDESLAAHGGASGLRDAGLLESALARPLNLVAYGDPDVCELAAAYGVGLAKNHAFVDGNKRAAFLAVGLFLRLNGHFAVDWVRLGLEQGGLGLGLGLLGSFVAVRRFLRV